MLDLLELFPNAKLYHLTLLVSHHSPLALRFVPKPRKKKLKKIVRFDLMWLMDQCCKEVIKEAWEDGTVTTSECVLNSCLVKCRFRLDVWNKTKFGHVSRKISEF